MKRISSIATCLLLCALSAAAQMHDTLMAGKGTPGPYRFSSRFVDSASVSVTLQNADHSGLLPAVFIPACNGLLFSDNLNSGDTVQIRWRENYAGLLQSTRLYPYDTVMLKSGLRDSGAAASAAGRSYFSQSSYEDLEVSGYKSISVETGSQGALTLGQALDVQVKGRLGSSTELTASLSDQGSSLDGQTRELGQIDQVYVSLVNPKYRMTAGDQFVELPAGFILSEQKKIKGISARYTGRPLAVGLAGALSGGRYAVEYIRTRQGFQGPYYLHGNGEADRIQPVAGTVVAEASGAALREGEGADFSIDTDLGSLRFNPSFPVSDGMVVKLSYEYKTYEYLRTFAAADVAAANADSSIRLNAALWFENDDRNTPLGRSLDSTDRQALSASGDRYAGLSEGLPVHPNDVPARDAVTRLYRKHSPADGSEVSFVYAPYEPSRPEDRSGRYEVWFAAVSPGTGAYSVAADTLADFRGRGPVFVYDSLHRGSFAVLSSLRPPARSVMEEARVVLHAPSGLFAGLDVAGTQYDHNLFSKKDDDDNAAGVVRSTAGFASPDSGGSIRLSHQYWTRRFGKSLVGVYERRQDWDLEYLPDTGAVSNTWLVDGYVQSASLIRVSGLYGGWLRERDLLSSRGAGRIDLGQADALHAVLDASGVVHGADLAGSWAGRGGIGAGTAFPALKTFARLSSEWRRDTAGAARGNTGIDVTAALLPVDFSQHLSFTRDMRSSGAIGAAQDSGHTFVWEQKLSLKSGAGAHMTGSTALLRRRIALSTLSTFLAIMDGGVVSRKTGLFGNASWRLSSEKASAFVVIPLYVGAGRGTHSYDSASGEYIPDRNGTFIVEERESYDTLSSNSVRKHRLALDWGFAPRAGTLRGILADLSWRGTLLLDEHRDVLDAQRALVWLPGWSSLTAYDTMHIRFADCSYRQELAWKPSFADHFTSKISVRPYLKRLRKTRETGLGLLFDATVQQDDWMTGAILQRTTLARSGAIGTIPGLEDRSAELREERNIAGSFWGTAAETFGFAAAKGYSGGNYWRLKPGLALRPKDKGFAELSYTWSKVNIPPPIEYPMAMGFAQGLSHSIEGQVELRAGQHVSVSGNWRSEGAKNTGKWQWLHVLGLELRAFL